VTTRKGETLMPKSLARNPLLGCRAGIWDRFQLCSGSPACHGTALTRLPL